MPFVCGDMVALVEDIPILLLTKGMTGLVLKVILNTPQEGYWFYELLIKDGHQVVEGRRLRLVRAAVPTEPGPAVRGALVSDGKK